MARSKKNFRKIKADARETALSVVNAARFQQLPFLNLSGYHNITKLPDLGNHKFEDIDISNTSINDLSALSGVLDSLVSLKLSYSRVSSLGYLKGCSRLKLLDARHTFVNDISALSNLTTLETLYLDNTPIRDITAIANLDRLAVGGLSFRDCPIDDPELRQLATTRNPERTKNVLALLKKNTSVELMEAPWAKQLLNLRQMKLGATWIEQDGRFVIDPSGSNSDHEASQNLVTQQLHSATFRKSLEFRNIAIRLDNVLGWRGIATASGRLSEALDGPCEGLPDRLGILYGSLLELGSFLDQDVRLQKRPDSNVDPLDPEVFRSLKDLIRTAAPFLRRFPTIRELDDESGAFLTDPELFEPATEATRIASICSVISESDASAITSLLEAAKRGEFQGKKAGVRGVQSVRNLLIVSATVMAGFLSSSVSSDFANRSTTVKHAGAMLEQAEVFIQRLVEELPDDLRAAFDDMIMEIERGPWHGDSQQGGNMVVLPPKAREDGNTVF